MSLNNRTVSALRQYAKQHNKEKSLSNTLSRLDRLLPLLGPQSHGRSMIFLIGQQLFQDTLRIVAPSCPDYSHHASKYTFETLGMGVPLLAQLHLTLLRKIKDILPQADLEIVLADQEARDNAIRSRLRITEVEFAERVQASAAALRHEVADEGITVHLMTTRFPDLLLHEARAKASLVGNITHGARIINDTHARRVMYEQLGVMSLSDRYTRTLETAAQYLALGHIARHEGFLVCNHETVNLAWYTDTRTAVLHNAVAIY